MRVFTSPIKPDGPSAAVDSDAGSMAATRPPIVRLAVILLVAWIALAVFPTLPSGLGVGLDASWGYSLNLAHAQHLVFGKQLVFTFGPLGYLTCPDFDLAEPAAVWLFWIVTYLLFIWGLIRCWMDLSWGVALVCTIALTTVILMNYAPFERIQIAFVALAVAAAGASRLRWFDYLLLAATAGVTFLIKLNDGITSGVLFYCLLLVRYRSARSAGQPVRTLYVLAIIPLAVSWVGLTLLQGDPLSIFPYVRNSLDIVLGYSEAMSVPGPMWQLGLALVSVLAIFVGVPAVVEKPFALLRNALPALAFGFFSFKHSMVRQDAHADAFQFKLAIAALFLLVCAVTARDRRILSACVVLGVAMGWFVMLSNGPQFASAALDRAKLSGLADNVAAFANWNETWQRLRERNRAALNNSGLEPAISAAITGGTVDSFPNRIDLVRSGGWKWRGRPVMQSYSAYTPRLDQMNAGFLSSSSAPDRIMMRLESIDGRHPFLDDAASWRALFNWYDLELAGTETYLLRRRPSPRFTDPQQVGSVEAGWDVEVPVPAVSSHQFLVMRAEVPKSFWGILRGAVFRLDAIFLEVTYASGKKVRGRAVRANLADGAWISDLPQRTDGTLPYFGRPGYGLRDRVASVRFVASVPSEFAGPIRISWLKVGYRNNDAGLPSNEAPALSLTSIWKPGQQGVSSAGAEIVNRADTLQVRPSQTDPNILFDIRQDLSKYKTILIRARYSKAGVINAFFGKQIEGRGLEGSVPVSGQWLDVYLNCASNSFWAKEAGSTLRFDPPDNSVGDEIQIGGIWGSTEAPFPKDQQMIFYPARGGTQGAAMTSAGTTGSDLPLIPGVPPAYIDRINGVPQADSPTVNAPGGAPLSIAGWAVDSGQLAGGIVVDLDGKLMPARYGLARSDVAGALHDPSLEKSGFTLEIPSTALGSGEHRLELRVINSGRSGYYSAKRVIVRIP